VSFIHKTQIKNFLPLHWPNQQTVTTALLLLANLVCHILDKSRSFTTVVNIPLRAISLTQSLYLNKRYKALLDAAAFGLMFTPNARPLTLGVDVIAEAVNLYAKPKSEKEGAMMGPGWIEKGLQFVWEHVQPLLPSTPPQSTDTSAEECFQNHFARPRENPNTLDGACKILNISEEQARDLTLVAQKRGEIVSELLRRLPKGSDVVANWLQTLINDTNDAYTFLTNKIHELPKLEE